MHLHKYGYWDGDGGSSLVLAHERAHSEAELLALTKQILPEAVERARSEEVVSEEERGEKLHWAYLSDFVADVLVERHGFKVVEYAGDFCPHGWTDIGDPTDECCYPEDREILNDLRRTLEAHTQNSPDTLRTATDVDP